jgi:hypothetical protein
VTEDQQRYATQQQLAALAKIVDLLLHFLLVEPVDGPGIVHMQLSTLRERLQSLQLGQVDDERG